MSTSDAIPAANNIPIANTTLNTSTTSATGATFITSTTSASGPTFAASPQALSFFNKSDSSSFIRPAFISDSFSFFDKKSKKNVSAIKKRLSIAITQAFSASSVYLSLTFSSLSRNDGRYKHHTGNVEIKLSTIFPESIVTTHRKTFVKTADLAYFSCFQKHSKVWDHRT